MWRRRHSAWLQSQLKKATNFGDQGGERGVKRIVRNLGSLFVTCKVCPNVRPWRMICMVPRPSHLRHLIVISFCLAHDVFKYLKNPKHKNKDLVISCSYFEIYGAKVRTSMCILSARHAAGVWKICANLNDFQLTLKKKCLSL